MSGLDRQFDENLVRVQAQRLQDARLAIGLTIHDFVQPLSTSRSQLDAIERANLDAFYAPYYYERLFRRYAETLSFSSQAIDEMVTAFTPQPPSVDAPGSAVPSAQPAPASHSPEASPDGIDVVEPTLKASPQASPRASPQAPGTTEEVLPEPAPASTQEDRPAPRLIASKPSSRLALEQRPKGFGWGSLVVFMSLGLLAAWLVTDQGEDRKTPLPNEASRAAPVAAEPPPAPEPPAAAPAPPPASAPLPSPPSVRAPAQPSAPPAAAPSPPPAPAAPSVVAPPRQAPPPAGLPPADAKPPSSALPAATAVSSGAPAVEIVPKGPSWIWVRQADESVREFAVSAGERVVFEQIPIYLVVARPEQAEVKISGRPVRLVRNDSERDLGRFGRSQLIEARSQGSTASLPLAPSSASNESSAASAGSSATSGR